MKTNAAGSTDALDVRHDMLLFAARRMVRYHRRREHFLDRTRDIGAFLTVFSGSATVATALASVSWALPWAALATALLSACEIAFQTARRARLHAELARDWGAFERDVRRARLQLTEEALIDLQARRLEIEAHEPPPLRVLDAMCHDEVVTAMGLPDAQRSNVTPLQRLLRNVVDFRADRIRKQMDAR